MRKQIANRLGAAHIRDTMQQFVAGDIDRHQAMESLQIGKSQLYELRTSYLAAKAAGKGDEWVPGSSGGNHRPQWSEESQAFLRKVLCPGGDAKRCSYAFAASEVGRLHDLFVDRSQVRHWAIEHGLQAPVRMPRPPAHVRRWQRKSIGELWQLDATPDYFLGRQNPSYSLIDMIDDCSRMQVGGRLYAHETVRSYLDVFYRSFNRFGMPLEICVDKASFFRKDDGTLTQLGRRLKFLDISFIFANSPEAKGKVERVHRVWQDRLPAYAASEGLTDETPIEDVNDHLGCLIDYRNGFEKHRDLGDTPLHAWENAVKEGRCKIRQPPTDGWWELIRSEWKGMMIGPRGRLVVGDTLCTTECANGTRVWCCHHLDGTISLVMNKPEKGTGPKIVFTNNPKIRKSR